MYCCCFHYAKQEIDTFDVNNEFTSTLRVLDYSFGQSMGVLLWTIVVIINRDFRHLVKQIDHMVDRALRDNQMQQERYGADLMLVSKASQAIGPYQPKAPSRAPAILGAPPHPSYLCNLLGNNNKL